MRVAHGAGRRGEPLLFLTAVVVGWGLARMATFSPPWTEVPAENLQTSAPMLSAPSSETSAGYEVARLHEFADRPTFARKSGALGARGNSSVGAVPIIPESLGGATGPPSGGPVLALSAPRPNDAAEPMEPETPQRRSEAEPTVREFEREGTQGRWSADGWLLLRHDTSTPLLSGRPSYGRSQAGAVIRYRLALSSPLRPEAHLRASAALAGARERELAAGLSVRPLPGVPLRLIAEARASELDHGPRVRPAAYAVSEFPSLPLPLGARAEAYVQAGYVGGAFATAFADGQARIERPLVRVGRDETGTEVSAGGGAWGGAQKGSARLDIGPTAALAFRLGDARARLAADYRFRVAGDAEPSSGPALTLSAGF